MNPRLSDLLLLECDDIIVLRVPGALKQAIHQQYPSPRHRANTMRAALVGMIADEEANSIHSPAEVAPAPAPAAPVEVAPAPAPAAPVEVLNIPVFDLSDF